MGSPKKGTAHGIQKRRNSKYIQQSSKRRKDSELKAGLQGFVITCDGGRERQGIREAIHLVERFYDKLGDDRPCSATGRAKADNGEANNQICSSSSITRSEEAAVEEDVKNNKASKGTNIQSLLEDEIAELRDIKQARFASLDTGCAGVIFIRMLQEDAEIKTRGPNEIAGAIIEECIRFRKPLTRFCLRFLPVQLTCYASAEEVRKMAEPLMKQYFPAVDTDKGLKFAVVCEARANTNFDRMEMINAIAKLIPQPHKVDLNNPEKTIVVQVVKTICTIGIVDNYKERAKYNIRQLTTVKEDNVDTSNKANADTPEDDTSTKSEERPPAEQDHDNSYKANADNPKDDTSTQSEERPPAEQNQDNSSAEQEPSS